MRSRGRAYRAAARVRASLQPRYTTADLRLAVRLLSPIEALRKFPQSLLVCIASVQKLAILFLILAELDPIVFTAPISRRM